MAEDNFKKLLGKFDDREDKLHYEKPVRVSNVTTRYYCIFRVGKRFKSMNDVKGFERYMNRRMEHIYENGIQNILIHGDSNITELLKNKLEGVKIRSDSVLCTDLLLTATHGFFNMPPEHFDKWVDINKKWLEAKFGDNILYSCLHLNQTTPHFHVLICPVFENKKGRKILSNFRYFGGKQRLRQWQDDYAEEMQKTFKSLNRGVKFSKAKHIEVKHYWQMMNEPLNENDIEQLTLKAKNAELVKIKLKAIERTLEVYKDYSRKTDIEKQELIRTNKELALNLKHTQTESEVYKQAIEILAEKYKLPQNAILRVLEHVQKDLNNERER